jgi:hypothetical protein
MPHESVWNNQFFTETFMPKTKYGMDMVSNFGNHYQYNLFGILATSTMN